MANYSGSYVSHPTHSYTYFYEGFVSYEYNSESDFGCVYLDGDEYSGSLDYLLSIIFGMRMSFDRNGCGGWLRGKMREIALNENKVDPFCLSYL